MTRIGRLQLRIRCKYPLDQLQGPELRNLKKHLMDSFKAYGLIQIARWIQIKTCGYSTWFKPMVGLLKHELKGEIDSTMQVGVIEKLSFF